MSGLYTPGLPAATLPFTGEELIPVDTQTGQGVAPQTAAASMSQLASYLSGSLPWVTGRFYALPPGAVPEAVLTVTATLYAYPIYIPNEVTVATLSVSCTTGQTGGACRLGIYADDGAGYPGALIYDSGAVAGLTSTTVVTKTDVDTTLQAGWYWIASIFTASGTFPSVAGIDAVYTQAVNASLGASSAANALATSATAATGISVAGTYGALPTTFTAGAALVVNADVPLVALGV